MPLDLTNEFIDKLAKPIFVLRMANAMATNKYASEAQVQGAIKRGNKARQEIRDLAEDYVLALELAHEARAREQNAT